MSILPNSEAQAITGWTLEYLTMLATWFTAIGTVGATTVALWLGHRAGRTKLKVKTEFDETLSILVTNLSHRLVTINKMSWRVGRKGNRQWVDSPASSARFNQGSIKLENGETAFFYIPLEDIHKKEPATWLRWLEEYIPHFDRPVREHIEGLCLKIHTSVGYTKKAVPPKDFLKALEEVLEKHAPKPKKGL